MSSCCPSTNTEGPPKKERFDIILWGSCLVIAVAVGLDLLNAPLPYISQFSNTVLTFLGEMWWGIALGIVLVGLMSKMPKEYYQVLLGRGDSFGGLIRATIVSGYVLSRYFIGWSKIIRTRRIAGSGHDVPHSQPLELVLTYIDTHCLDRLGMDIGLHRRICGDCDCERFGLPNPNSERGATRQSQHIKAQPRFFNARRFQTPNAGV
jgi:hypothetical protein